MRKKNRLGGFLIKLFLYLLFLVIFLNALNNLVGTGQEWLVYSNLLLILIITIRFFNSAGVFVEKTRRYTIIFILMFLSLISVILSIGILNVFFSFTGLSFAIADILKITSEHVDEQRATLYIIFILVTAYFAYYIYKFLFMLIFSLMERWFQNKLWWKNFSYQFDSQLLKSYFTILVLFGGLLPYFIVELKSESDVFNKRIESFLFIIFLGSFLPTAHLLFKQNIFKWTK